MARRNPRNPRNSRNPHGSTTFQRLGNLIMRTLIVCIILVLIGAALHALHYVLGREGLQPVLIFGLFGGWSLLCVYAGGRLAGRAEMTTLHQGPPPMPDLAELERVLTGVAQDEQGDEQEGQQRQEAPQNPPSSFSL